jgi:hypothetical protein
VPSATSGDRPASAHPRSHCFGPGRTCFLRESRISILSVSLTRLAAGDRVLRKCQTDPPTSAESRKMAGG